MLWVSPASPIKISGTQHTCGHQSLLLLLFLVTLPLSSSRPEHVLFSGGTCVGNMTQDRAHQYPRSRDHQRKPTHTFLQPDEAYQFGRNLRLRQMILGVCQRSTHCQQGCSHRRAPSRHHGYYIHEGGPT